MVCSADDDALRRCSTLCDYAATFFYSAPPYDCPCWYGTNPPIFRAETIAAMQFRASTLSLVCCHRRARNHALCTSLFLSCAPPSPSREPSVSPCMHLAYLLHLSIAAGRYARAGGAELAGIPRRAIPLGKKRAHVICRISAYDFCACRSKQQEGMRE